MKDIKETLTDITNKARAAKISWMTYTLVFIGAGYMLFIGGWLLGLSMIVFNIALYFLLGRKLITAHENALNEASIRYGLCAGMKKAVFTGSEGLSAEEFASRKMLPFDPASGKLLVRQGFQCRKDKMTVRGWEITFHYPDLSAGKNKYEFMSGSLFTCTGDDGGKLPDLLLLRKNMLTGQAEQDLISRYHQLPFSEEENGFCLYAGGEEEPDASLAAGYQELIRAVPALGAVRTDDQSVCIYLNNRFYTEKVRPGFIPSETQLKRNPLPELDAVLAFFRTALKNKIEGD